MPSDNPTLEVTSIEDWDVAEGNVIPLPSGKNVRCIRTMDLLDLLKSGRIPNPLGPIVQSMVQGGGMPAADQVAPEAILEMLKLVDETVVRCVTEPKVQAPPPPEEEETAEQYMERVRKWKPDPGYLALGRLDIEDRMFIFTYAQGFAADLASFREETSKAMARLSDGKPVPKPTKRTGGGKR